MEDRPVRKNSVESRRSAHTLRSPASGAGQPAQTAPWKASMIVVMSREARQDQAERVGTLLRENGVRPVFGAAEGATVLIAEESGTRELASAVQAAGGVDRVVLVPGAQRVT